MSLINDMRGLNGPSSFKVSVNRGELADRCILGIDAYLNYDIEELNHDKQLLVEKLLNSGKQLLSNLKKDNHKKKTSTKKLTKMESEIEILLKALKGERPPTEELKDVSDRLKKFFEGQSKKYLTRTIDEVREDEVKEHEELLTNVG